MTASKLIARYNQLSNRIKLVDGIYNKISSTQAYKYFRVRNIIEVEQVKVNDAINKIAINPKVSNSDFKRINKFLGLA